ncbi:alpha/beta fold hydrolase [Ekhidna sp.]|uniref:S9 family peptidase n=1 Tax=Ekhidna sp. TaxID=2608089 RepID=UPI003B510AAA
MRDTILLLLTFSCQFAVSQSQNQSALTIDQIMQGEAFVGYLPTSIRWTDDSKAIDFSWNPEMDTIRSTYQADITTKEITKLTPEELLARSADGDYSADYRWKVYEKNGDLFLKDLSTYETKQITNTLERESNPVFASNDSQIVYQIGNNLFQWNISEGTTRQLTDFKAGSENEPKESEQDQWLEQDQLAYFDILRKRKNESDARKYRSEQSAPDRPETIYIGSKRMVGMTISPNMKFIVYRLQDEAKEKRTIVPDYVTQSGYTTDLNARTKVGGKQDKFETWVLNLENDENTQIETKDIEGIYDKPIYKQEYVKEGETWNPMYEEPRSVSIGLPVFSEDGKAVVNITSEDYKDRWIMLLDLNTAKLSLIDRQHDDAWIAGDGIGWFSRPTIEWIDNDNIWFKSEESGYAHLYTANVKTGKIKALTKGEFEILDVQLSRNKETFFITSNKVSPHEIHFYHMPVKGGEMTQITSLKGGHQTTISPDEQQLAIRYGYTNKPWELYVMPNQAGASMTQLTESTTEAFKSYNWLDSEIIRFTARDGVEVPATLYEPEADKKNGAAVVFVHGAGYTQNVHYWWPSYYREYMFHNFLRDNGYTVLAIDFRASRGYGRDWRTGIYRHMGGKDLDDQVDGVKYLVEQKGIDEDRIGIYGGSYGGFITFMAMFTTPDVFKSGASLRPVSDWAHYNHPYTANILNTPLEDSLAYARSSPIYFAEGLKGNLLILHGMIDTNVHFQDVVRLSQRLIELKKENWELAVFPLEGHGFREASSWSDEYRRIYKLFDETLRK